LPSAFSWNETLKAMADWGFQNIDFQQIDNVLDVGRSGEKH